MWSVFVNKKISCSIWNSVNSNLFMAGIQKSLKNSKSKFTVHKALYKNFGIWAVYKPKKAILSCIPTIFLPCSFNFLLEVQFCDAYYLNLSDLSNLTTEFFQFHDWNISITNKTKKNTTFRFFQSLEKERLFDHGSQDKDSSSYPHEFLCVLDDLGQTWCNCHWKAIMLIILFTSSLKFIYRASSEIHFGDFFIENDHNHMKVDFLVLSNFSQQWKKVIIRIPWCHIPVIYQSKMVISCHVLKHILFAP